MPSAASGETLAERAKRFLGLDLDVWLSTELKSDSQPTRGSRTEQVAQAQRKHRQRTQSYIQALEGEVLRLRGIELALKEEVEKARQQVPSNHVNLQGESLGIPASEAPSDTGSGAASPETIVVSWDDFYQLSPEQPCCISAAENTPPEIAWTATLDEATESHSSSVMWADAFRLAQAERAEGTTVVSEKAIEIDQSSLNLQMGVKYILKLEKPCMSHLKHATLVEPRREGYIAAPYNYGTNHAYNLSTRLYHEHTSASEPGYAQVSNLDLSNLLEASERLQLADELTPVQVWALVRKLDAISPIDPAMVDAMFEALSGYSYCNSFGSAIGKATLREAFRHFLGWSHDL